MSFYESLIIAAIPTLIGIIGTYLITYKSNITDNTKALENLSDRIGLDKELTLKKSIENKFTSISNDIGRADNSSLTKQHNEIKQSIQKSFSVIEKRYSDEDAEYRKFTQNQYDLKKTLDNFSRDYYEHIKAENNLYEKCIYLETQNNKLINENQQLKQTIEKQNQILKYQSHHKPDNQRSHDEMEL